MHALNIMKDGRMKNTGEERVVFIDKMGVDKKGNLYVEGPNTTLQEIH